MWFICYGRVEGSCLTCIDEDHYYFLIIFTMVKQYVAKSNCNYELL